MFERLKDAMLKGRPMWVKHDEGFCIGVIDCIGFTPNYDDFIITIGDEHINCATIKEVGDLLNP